MTEKSRKERSSERKTLVVIAVFIAAAYAFFRWVFRSGNGDGIAFGYLKSWPDWISRGFWPLDLAVIALCLWGTITLAMWSQRGGFDDGLSGLNLAIYFTSIAGSAGLISCIAAFGWFGGVQVAIIAMIGVCLAIAIVMFAVRGLAWLVARALTFIGHAVTWSWRCFGKSRVGAPIYRWLEALDTPDNSSDNS